MKNLCSLLVSFFCLTFFASAQKVYFIYFQTEDHSPFYVKMNDKILSSSSTGYLIMSDLKDSAYNFSIGFPSTQKESKFSVTITGKDRGFLIKNFESGLGLFDLQNASVIKAQKDESDQNVIYQRRNDDFASLLSKAANDTSLLYAIVRKVPVQELESVIAKQIKPDVLPEIRSNEVKSNIDSVITQQENPIVVETLKSETGDSSKVNTAANTFTDTEMRVEEKNDRTDTLGNVITNRSNIENKIDVPSLDTALVSSQTEVYRRSIVKRHAESSTSEGFGLIYYDDYGNAVDTIRLIIPNPRIVFKQQADTMEKQDGFIHISELNKDTLAKLPVVVSAQSKTTEKTNCKSIATNSDFLKLRKNMAAKETDEGMVDEAKKVFKSKCFSTEQIKNLSVLFLTSAGKYQFFDAAFFHVSDQNDFSSLESEIKDDYYIRRFKALIGQ